MTIGHLMAETNFMENFLTKIKVSVSEREKNSELEELETNMLFQAIREWNMRSAGDFCNFVEIFHKKSKFTWPFGIFHSSMASNRIIV